MIVVRIRGNASDRCGRGALREQRIAPHQFRNRQTGSGDAAGKLASRKHIPQFKEQRFAGEKLDLSVQRGVYQSGRRLMPKQAGNDRIRVKHQSHARPGRVVPLARP